MYKYLLSIFLLILIGIFLFFYFFQKNKETEVVINNKIYITAEVADNIIARMKGLSGKEKLAQNKSMLFVFNNYKKYGFWMKDMNFSLDIVWIKDNEIVEVTERINNQDQRKIYRPQTAINYALEVNSGFVEKNKLKIGDRVDIIDNDQ